MIILCLLLSSNSLFTVLSVKGNGQEYNYSSHGYDPDPWGHSTGSIHSGNAHQQYLDLREPLELNRRFQRNPSTLNGPSSASRNVGGNNNNPGFEALDPGRISLYYAYPTGAAILAANSRISQGPGVVFGPGQIPGELYYTEEQKESLLQNALDAAWEQYGPKTKPRVQNIPGHQQSQQSQQQLTYTHRDTSGPLQYNPNTGFQPWESEWDTNIMALPPPGRPAMEPSFFNRLMASYIDFEVNNHELADFLRRAVAVGFIGLVIIAWVGLGIYLGLFPLKWLYFLGVGRKRDTDGQERVDSYGSNDLMAEITDRIFLALDGDWLRKLEERVTKSGDNPNWLKIHVQCCILPDAKTKGMADCQLVRKKGRKESAFKCLTDLIYNFQFNPTPKPSGSSDSKSGKSQESNETENS